LRCIRCTHLQHEAVPDASCEQSDVEQLVAHITQVLGGSALLR
jgi:hypothetical protein